VPPFGYKGCFIIILIRRRRNPCQPCGFAETRKMISHVDSRKCSCTRKTHSYDKLIGKAKRATNHWEPSRCRQDGLMLQEPGDNTKLASPDFPAMGCTNDLLLVLFSV